MEIKSTPAIVNANIKTAHDFLIDARNMEHLLPMDKVSEFKADEKKCSFKVQGGFEISLIEEGSNGSSEVYLRAGESSPFPFKLTVHLLPISDTETEGFIHFNGEVNMFLKMMVEKPLSALFEFMTKQLQTHFA